MQIANMSGMCDYRRKEFRWESHGPGEEKAEPQGLCDTMGSVGGLPQAGDFGAMPQSLAHTKGSSLVQQKEQGTGSHWDLGYKHGGGSSQLCDFVHMTYLSLCFFTDKTRLIRLTSESNMDYTI